MQSQTEADQIIETFPRAGDYIGRLVASRIAQRAPALVEEPSNGALMTPREAAAYLRVSTATLRRNQKLHKLPAAYVSRRPLYRKSDLDRWLLSRETRTRR